MSTVAILGTLDTKGKEYLYLKSEIERHGVKTLVLDAGTQNKPYFRPDFSAHELADAAGTSLEAILTGGRMQVAQMGTGAGKIVADLVAENKVQGFISMGGSQGANIAAKVMEKLPVGFPKLLVSTQICVDKRQIIFADCKDMFGVNPTTDVAGLNSIMKTVLGNAAAAIAGMAENYRPVDSACERKLRIGITMLGITTPCVSRVEKLLEDDGFEVFIYHATGYGGRNMELMVRDGYLDAVADITTSELGQQIVGRGAAAEGGPPRLIAAAESGIPQVVSLGGLDHVNYLGAYPAEFEERAFVQNNAVSRSVRTSAEENEEFGKAIAERLNAATGPVTVVIPKGGLSQFTRQNDKFIQPQTDEMLFEALRQNLSDNVKLVESEHHINDSEFAELVYKELRSVLEL